MRDFGIGSWPARVARTRPDGVAMIHLGVSTTFAEVAERTARLANALRAKGIGRGDRIAYLGHNSSALAETLFAAARLGAVFVPLNTRLAPPETAYILRDCEPSLFVWGPSFENTVEHPDVKALGIPTVAVGEDPRAGEFEALLRSGDPTPLDEPISHDDLVMIQYTSGTSGHPKGVMMTHGNITWNVLHVILDMDLTQGTVALVAAPMFHTAGLNVHFLPTFLKGGTALIEESWRPERMLDLIAEHRVTYLFGVTSMYQSLAQSPRWAEADLSSVSVAESGGSPLPEVLLRTYADRGVAIIQGFGLTESSPGATILPPADTVRKLGSAGLPHTFADARIVRPDFTTADVDEVGEILVQGPNVTKGYWRNEEATKAAFVDGDWLRTGDLARVDSDGYIYIVDRLKDMIISGGENVYPAEVEAAIVAHPAVDEAAVIGVPDARWGEVGRAVVTLRPGASLTPEELLGFLDGRIARYKIPKSAVIVEALPHNASGKLVKRTVKEQFSD
jgi:fatty-acyl-CoA synthase